MVAMTTASRNPTEHDEEQQFRHQLLTDSLRIRLLKLLPGESTSPISVTIDHNVAIKDPPIYEALSYEWREESGTQLIRCNGLPLRVTSNLLAALHALRLPYRSRTLWVDAICIDQNNLAERSSQVAFMTWIYFRAIRTIVWVGGEAAPLTGRVMKDLIPVLASIWNARLAADSSPAYTWGPTFRSVSELPDPSVAPALRLDDRDLWDACFGLLSSSYFTRVWVRQEIIVSPTAVVVCGPYSVSWDPFLAAASGVVLCSFLHSRVDWTSDREIGFGALGSLSIEHRRFRDPKTRLELVGLLHGCQGLHAKDPRDFVYAMLGLASPRWWARKQGLEEVPIEPDYFKPVEQVYREAAEYIIWERQDLRLLSVQITSSKRIKDLPTWVPDWSGERERPAVPSGDGSALARCLDGCTEVDGKSLFVNGVTFGTIILSTRLQPVLENETTTDAVLNLVYTLQGVKIGLGDEYVSKRLVGGQWINDEDLASPTAESRDKPAPIEAQDEESSGAEHLVEQLQNQVLECKSNLAVLEEIIERGKEPFFYSTEAQVFLTDSGYFGLWTSKLVDKIRVGDDEVWVLGGGYEPIILRPRHKTRKREGWDTEKEEEEEGGCYYERVCTAYIEGLNDGKGLGFEKNCVTEVRRLEIR